ncbi:nitrous oxide reductase accessory protein NosL [Flavobacterium sp. CYK-55]|uniref:nitrous oxide reductase accessory protein NosL n=1 Tax=Flavobacterium sp. CYK-55 TaxID=2835529 RepID=UPI001BCA8D5C|nr:nitrous oxide reductase accessory protein NosL [Flavobacterium sp. CYK-55]MBS7786607.1 nitrous oxide reductase accessory protein NosL [Flavobacterium sp. CYK-55]
MKKVFLMLLLWSLWSCNGYEPQPIELNIDSCDFCKMTIANSKFSAELITQKGRCYKFDDLACMIQFAQSNTVVPYRAFYVNDYLQDNHLIAVEKAYLLKGGSINSPMRGNFAAFADEANQKKMAQTYQAQLISWSSAYKSYQ